MVGIQDTFEDNAKDSHRDEWRREIEAVLERLKVDLPELSNDPKVLGMGAHGIQ